MAVPNLGPGDGEVHERRSVEVLIKPTGADTDESPSLAESTIAPSFAGRPHWHEHLHDMFYILDGTLTLQVGGAVRALGRGSFACIPPRVEHSFRNDTNGPVCFLNFTTPGWANYMLDLAEAARPKALTTEVIGRIAARYDLHTA